MLAALFVLHYEREYSEGDYDDTLVFHRINVAGANHHFTMQALLRLAERWQWSKILEVPGLENPEFDTDTVAGRNQIYATIGPDFDIVMTVRNWQKSNFRLLHAYHAAKKICYGDGFGHFDSIVAEGYPNFDEGVFLVPLQFSTHHLHLIGDQLCKVVAFDSIPWRKIPKDLALRFIKDYCRSDLYLQYYTKRLISEEASYLVCLSTHSESGTLKSAQDEVNVYLETILEKLPPDNWILLKPHPRENEEKALLLSQELKSRGRNALVAFRGTYIEKLPLELIADALPPSIMLTDIAVSSSSMHLPYFTNRPMFRIWDRILAHFNEAGRKEAALMDSLATRITKWDDQGIFYKP